MPASGLEEVRSQAQICISCVTEAELLYGYHRAGVGPDRFRSLDVFFAKVDVLPWSREEAGVYAKFRVEQERSGKVPGELDMLIAAHAILVTHDFALKQAQVPTGIEDWAGDL